MIDRAAAEVEPAARDRAWKEVNRAVTETATTVPWSWDEDILPYSADAVNAYYQTFTTTIDWVNVGVRQ
jgi:hypothetical protein